MHYEIEVDVARKRSSPVWTPMINNENEEVSIWANDIEARAFIQNDTRSLRLIRVDSGHRVAIA